MSNSSVRLMMTLIVAVLTICFWPEHSTAVVSRPAEPLVINLNGVRLSSVYQGLRPDARLANELERIRNHNASVADR